MYTICYALYIRNYTLLYHESSELLCRNLIYFQCIYMCVCVYILEIVKYSNMFIFL